MGIDFRVHKISWRFPCPDNFTPVQVHRSTNTSLITTCMQFRFKNSQKVTIKIPSRFFNLLKKLQSFMQILHSIIDTGIRAFSQDWEAQYQFAKSSDYKNKIFARLRLELWKKIVQPSRRFLPQTIAFCLASVIFQQCFWAIKIDKGSNWKAA